MGYAQMPVQTIVTETSAVLSAPYTSTVAHLSVPGQRDFIPGPAIVQDVDGNGVSVEITSARIVPDTVFGPGHTVVSLRYVSQELAWRT